MLTILGITIVGTSCGGNGSDQRAPSESRSQVTSPSRLAIVAALRSQGLQLDRGRRTRLPEFSRSGFAYLQDDEGGINIFEFPNEESARAAADGWSVVSDEETSYLYRRRRVVLTYDGDDARARRVLRTTLGPPIKTSHMPGRGQASAGGVEITSASCFYPHQGSPMVSADLLNRTGAERQVSVLFYNYANDGLETLTTKTSLPPHGSKTVSRKNPGSGCAVRIAVGGKASAIIYGRAAVQ
jgi:hypothetical protein